MVSFAPAYHPQQSVFDHIESELALELFDTKERLRRRRLSGLLREAEMNIRLRELMQSRERVGTPLPPVEITPAQPAQPVVERKAMTSVLGMQGGVIQAAIEKAKQRLVAKQAEGLAKIDSATSSAEAKIDGVTSNLAAKIESEIEAQVSDFVTMTNGGPV